MARIVRTPNAAYLRTNSWYLSLTRAFIGSKNSARRRCRIPLSAASSPAIVLPDDVGALTTGCSPSSTLYSLIASSCSSLSVSITVDQASMISAGKPCSARLDSSAVAGTRPRSGNASWYRGPGVNTGQVSSPSRVRAGLGLPMKLTNVAWCTFGVTLAVLDVLDVASEAVVPA